MPVDDLIVAGRSITTRSRDTQNLSAPYRSNHQNGCLQMNLTKQQREHRAELAQLLKEQQTEADVAIVANEETLAWLEAGHHIHVGHTSGYVSVRTSGDLPIALYVHPRKVSVAISGDDEAAQVATEVKGARIVRRGSKAETTIYAEFISAIVRRPIVRTLVQAALQRGH